MTAPVPHPTVAIRRLGRGDAAALGRADPDVFDEPVLPSRIAAYLAEEGQRSSG